MSCTFYPRTLPAAYPSWVQPFYEDIFYDLADLIYFAPEGAPDYLQRARHLQTAIDRCLEPPPTLDNPDSFHYESWVSLAEAYRDAWDESDEELQDILQSITVPIFREVNQFLADYTLQQYLYSGTW